MYEQISVFYPTIIYIGNQFVQSIKQETYIENPDTKKWHLFQFSYASGKNWRVIINNSSNCNNLNNKYCHQRCPSIHVSKYQSYQHFFEATDRVAKHTPIISKFAYLTAVGASRHNLFYALDVNGEYRHIGLTQMLDGWFDAKEQKIVPIQLMPNGKIVPLADNTTLPQRFETVHTPLIPSEQGASNLHLALEALKSNSPDAAMLLLALMSEISVQSFGSTLPGVDMTLATFVDSQVREVSNNGKWRVSATQMRMLHALFYESNGWWDWIWNAEGNFRPKFQPNIAA